MVEQAAQGHSLADEAGQHQRQQGNRQNIHARLPQVIMGRVEGRQRLHAAAQIVQFVNKLQPAAKLRRIGRYRKQNHKNVKQGRGYNRQGQHRECALMAEPEFPG